MGFESYITRLTGQHSIETISHYLVSKFGAQTDPTQTGSWKTGSYYVFQDGLHVIEFEVYKNHPSCDLFIRFALCHPNSVDDILINIIKSTSNELRMNVIVHEIPPDRSSKEFKPEDDVDIEEKIRLGISLMREQWHKTFGPEEIGLSVADACKKFYFRSTGEQSST